MAFELMMEGVPVPIIQRQLGHANLATTQRYLDHIAPKDVVEAMGQREWHIHASGSDRRGNRKKRSWQDVGVRRRALQQVVGRR